MKNILSTLKLLVNAIAISLLLTACVTSQPPKSTPEQKQKAAESNTSLGLGYMNRGQYEVALGKLKKALADVPDYAPAHTVLAVLYEQLGETELAGKHYKKAYEYDPENGDVNNNYGVFLCRKKNVSEALEHFEKALDDPFYRSPAVALTNAGSCSLEVRKWSQADNYLRRALKFDAKFPDALLTMAQLKRFQQDNLRARAFVQRFEAVSVASAQSLLLGFQIESALQNEKSVSHYLNALNSQFPESEEARTARSARNK